MPVCTGGWAVPSGFRSPGCWIRSGENGFAPPTAKDPHIQKHRRQRRALRRNRSPAPDRIEPGEAGCASPPAAFHQKNPARSGRKENQRPDLSRPKRVPPEFQFVWPASAPPRPATSASGIDYFSAPRSGPLHPPRDNSRPPRRFFLTAASPEPVSIG